MTTGGTDRGTELRTRSDVCNGTIDSTFIPHITTTPPTPNDPLTDINPLLVDFNGSTATSETIPNDELDGVHKESTSETNVDECALMSRSKQEHLDEQEILLVEISRKVAPLRSPLFSRVHLSSAEIENQIGNRRNTIGILKSQTPSRNHSGKHFKYLNRQISVSSPTLHQPEKMEHLHLCSKTEGRKETGSALFYVNDDDEENETNENQKVLDILNFKRSSIQSIRSIVSCQTGWTISSKKRLSINSRLEFDEKDLKDAIDETPKTDDEPIVLTFPLHLEIDERDNTELTQQDCAKRKPLPKLLLTIIASLLFPVFSVIVYLWDFWSDVELAQEYWHSGHLSWFGVTTLCIVLPVLLMTIMDISWLWMDRPIWPYNKTFIVRFVLGLFGLGRLVRAFKYMDHLVKSILLVSEEKRRWNYDRAMDEKRDCYMLDFISTFIESVPQLIVQRYLYYMYDLPMTTLRLLNILSSWISIAWVYAAYYRCNRQAMVGRKDVNFLGFTCFFLSVLACLASRVTSIVHFMLTYDVWIIVVIVLHTSIALLWLVLRVKPEMEGVVASKLGRCLYYLFFAYVYNVCFLHLNNRPGKYRMIIFYVLLYIENFILAGLTMYQYSDAEFVDAKDLLAIPAGLFLHVLFLIVFYKFFLPKALLR